MENRCIGFVLFWDAVNGRGWITPQGGKGPIYVTRDHIDHPCKNLSEDQQVSFTLELAAGRFEARNVRP
jgi:cold shock CspA family protein